MLSNFVWVTGCELPSVLLTKRYDKFIDTMTNFS